MQYHNEKISFISLELGRIIKKLRKNKSALTLERLAYEYDIPKGTLSKIERGVQNCQFVNLWKISEALGIKCSEIVKMLEDELGEDFTLVDE